MFQNLLVPCGLERLIMGSVTHRVLETTRLPMLVIKPVQLATGLA